MSSSIRKLRVLFIVPSLRRAGAETQVVDLVNGLSSDFIEKHLCTFQAQVDQAGRIDQASVDFHKYGRNGKFDLRLARQISELIKE